MENFYKAISGFAIFATGCMSDPLNKIVFAILAVGFLLAGCAHMLADEIRRK